MNFVKAKPLLFLAIVNVLPWGCSEQRPIRSAPGSSNQDSVATYGRQSLSFEANGGQAAADVNFLSHGRGYTLFLTSNEAVLALKKRPSQNVGPDGVAIDSTGDAGETARSAETTVLSMQLVGANPESEGTGTEQLAAKVNYFIGHDPTQWRTNIPTFTRVKYQDVYPGIDLVYYGNGEQQLEYDFVVAPGADPAAIRLAFEGSRWTGVDAGGDLVIETADEAIRMLKPVVYQIVDGIRHEIHGEIVPLNQNQVGFKVGTYDHDKPLVIDPVLVYSTFLGGGNIDEGIGVAVDDSGNAYVTGGTRSVNFPTAGPLQPTHTGDIDAFVTKLDWEGKVIYSTYLGNESNDEGGDIAVDAEGNVYLVGTTRSRNFPTVNPVQSDYGGGSFDAFVAKLSADGSALIYSTFVGGRENDLGVGIAVDQVGDAYITGWTHSTDFPVVSPGVQCSEAGFFSQAFASKLSRDGADLTYSTCLPEPTGNAQIKFFEGWGIAVDPAGVAYVTGRGQLAESRGNDAVITKLDVGGRVVRLNFLGGSQSDEGRAIAVDEEGLVYVTGQTWSPDFPVGGPSRSGMQFSYAGSGDAFLTKMTLDDAVLLYSTFLGGSERRNFPGGDVGLALAVDDLGNVYVAGRVESQDFATESPVQQAYDGGTGDAFVAKFDATGAATYRSFLGGSGFDEAWGIASDCEGTAYVVGRTSSSDFRAASRDAFTGGGFDAFVVRIEDKKAEGTPFEVAGGGGLSVTASACLRVPRVGYGRIAPNLFSAAPFGFSIFAFRQNGVLVTEAGVPASVTTQSGRIYAEVDGPVNTGIAIANPNEEAAAVSFFFTDSDGNDFGTGTTTIPANGQISRFLNEDPFNGGASLNGTFTFSSSVPVSVIALRGFTSERSEFLITTLPITSLSALSGDPVVYPHFADGGGWTSQIVLVNPTDSPIGGSLLFLGQGTATETAQPVLVTISGQTGNTFPYEIPPRGSRRFQTGGEIETARVGSVRVIPAADDIAPSGLLVFRFKPGVFTVSEAGVAALGTGSVFRVYAEAVGSEGETGSIRTGIGITNLSENPATITFELNELDGTSAGLTGSALLPGSGQMAKFLDQINGLESLPLPFQGVVRISTSASEGIGVVGIRSRWNERGDFLTTTTPPANEADGPPRSQVFFPHLVDHGGFTTQLILHSVGQSSRGQLHFFTQSGAPLGLALK